MSRLRQFIHKLFSFSYSDSKTQTCAPPFSTEALPRRLEFAQHHVSRKQMSHAAVEVVRTLIRAGFTAYIVGGAVRDALLGLTPKDFDVVTNARPEEITRLFRRAIVIGRRFRIVHVYFERELIEVTTFRSMHDGQTDDTGRVLSDNVFGSEAEDAARRDFTVNALFYEPLSETIIDYHHGMEDLNARKLVMIGEPEARYREDPVRILRAIRLSAKLGLSIDETCLAPIASMASLLANVPHSRLLDEVFKMLCSGKALACLSRVHEYSIPTHILPFLKLLSPQSLQTDSLVYWALKSTDERVAEGKSVSVGFLLAAILWKDLQSTWADLCSMGMHPNIAVSQALTEVLQQHEQLSIPRKYINVMSEIWLMQPRFLRRQKERAMRFIGQARFRAAYDFLSLRAQVGDADPSLFRWWTDFLGAEDAERERLLSSVAANLDAPKKKRRRSKKRKKKTMPDHGMNHE